MTAPPLITIAMPALNCERTLACALRGIILQTYPNWELLIVDDGSTDATVGVAEQFCDDRIIIFRDGEHLGLAARLSQAIGAARGTYLARMDGDDISFPQRLATQLRFLEARPEIDLVGTDMLVFNSRGSMLGVRRGGTTHDEICRRPWAQFPLAHPTWMGRIEWFRRFRYREDALRMEDQDLLLRSYAQSRFAGIPNVLVAFREDSISLQKILQGRLNYCLALARTGGMFAAKGIPAHLLKAALDVVAVGSGLRYRLLRNRAQPGTADIANAWQELWSKLLQTEKGAFEAAYDR